MKIHKETCSDMVSTKDFSNGFQTFPLQLGSVNTFTSFTHGSVKYDGSNIACLGESLRLQDGRLNLNMIKQIHYSITIIEIQLMEIGPNVIQPYKQTVLGHSSNGVSHSGHSTYIWSPPQPDCDLLEIMISVTPSTWFNDVHKIEITALASYYHNECKLSVIKTTSPSIF